MVDPRAHGEHVGSRLDVAAGVRRLDAAVHLDPQGDSERIGTLPEVADALERVGCRRAAAEPDRDREEVDHVDGRQELIRDRVDRRVLLHGHADAAPLGPNVLDDAPLVVRGLEVEEDKIRARVAHRLHEPLRPLDHQMNLDRERYPFPYARDDLIAEADAGSEMAVDDVQ